MSEPEEFNTLAFEKRLLQLKDTQESIQGLSSWCLKQRGNHKKIVASWLNVLKRVKVESRLVLFYLANDVIQYSKRKNYEFVESWGLNLQKATPLVRDEKVRHKILRIFKIWEQRGVYDEEFLSDLTGLLSAGAVKKTDDDALDFQPQLLVNKIKQCSVLETDTDMRLKNIHESELQLNDMDALALSLKDQSDKEAALASLAAGVQCVERCTQALQREIVAREALLALLQAAHSHYSTQRGEVKVVAYAYKNFGTRVRALKRKLDELLPTLSGEPPSPPRAEDVPSPSPDDDIALPANGDADSYDIDKTFNTSLAADGALYNMGFSSFLNSENPLALFDPADIRTDGNGSKIEVISNRLVDTGAFDINKFIKNLVPSADGADSVSVVSGTLSQQSQDTLPGLDLLTPDSSGNPPPPSGFYAAADSDDLEPYHPESTQPWDVSNSWTVPPPSLPPLPVPPVAPPLTPMTPAMTPMTPVMTPMTPAMTPAPRAPPVLSHSMPPASPPNALGGVVKGASDIDHRSILPPPPPPPPLIPTLSILGQLEDVDHRSILASLPPPPAPQALNRSNSKDVDHRNLISLTHQPAPQRMKTNIVDQDYRVPPPVAPPDIVESVDMDLSDDEPNGYPMGDESANKTPASSPAEPFTPDTHAEARRFTHNNKVLVGGHNGTANPELRRLSAPQDYDERASDMPPLSNPFDNMPNALKMFNNFQSPTSNFREDPRQTRDSQEEDREEDFRDHEWPPQDPRFMNRFPRNWSPRTSFRGQGPQFSPGPGPGQFRPQRSPARPWRPQQRFW